MGQRHQLFVIAKINGRYRTLCAIHHQWLYGHTALRRCRDTLNIFGDALNRLPIQQELRSASKKDESFWAAATSEEEESFRAAATSEEEESLWSAATSEEEDTKNSHIPFPFIATCLILGASFNVDGYHHKVRVNPFYMKYDEGDNNNGITIFDISDTSDVCYCFVDFFGMESKRRVPLETPLSARTYLKAYCDIDHKSLKKLLKSFEGVKLVATDALIDTWPDGEWRQPESEAEDAVGSPDMPELKVSPLTLVDAPKTLRDQSMEKLLDAFFENPEDASQLVAEVEVMTDFIPKLHHKFYAKAATLQPSPALLSLLCRALEHETEIYLSPFKTLTMNDISVIVTELRTGKMEVLDLSDMPHLKEPDLKQILDIGTDAPGKDSARLTSPSSTEISGAIGGLKALILLDNPQISLDFLAKYLGDCEVYHSELYRRTVGRHRDSPVPNLEFVAPNIVSQLVWIGISEAYCSNPTHRRDNKRFDWENLQYLKRVPMIMDRPKDFAFEQFPLDIPLPTIKMTAGLMRLLKYLSSRRWYWFESWAPIAAACFAHVPTSRAMSGYSVGPLSTTLSGDSPDLDFLDYGTQVNENGPLRKGQWTIILVHEGFDVRDWRASKKDPELKTKKSLRYVLAKALAEPAASGKSFLVTDVPTHLNHVLGGEKGANAAEVKRMSEWWENAISGIDGEVGYYAGDDIYEILERVYSVNKAAVEEES